MRMFFKRLMLAMAVATSPWALHAQTMPTQPGKPVTVVVSFPAGGAPDQIARLLASRLQARWKTPVVVMNRPGASGNIGNDSVARAEPDGHTLLVTPNTFTMTPFASPKGAGGHADVVRDYTPISLLSTSSMLLLARPSLGVKSAKELVRLVQSGKELSYATPGNGSPMHVVGEMFNKVAKVNLPGIPYKGTSPAINDVLGGHVGLIYLGLPVAKPLIDSGKLVALATADTRRSPFLPEVPTLAEQGYPGVDIDIWFGVYGPGHMPAALADDIHQTLREIMAESDIAGHFKRMYQEIQDLSRQAFIDKTRADYERYGRLFREFDITAD